MSDVNEKDVPPPAPQAATYAQRFATATRPADPGVAATGDKGGAPVPQGAPAANYIADAKSD
ncbi:MAG: hypothetical protein JWL72_881 [Ilumatobacteraceae bacterium]|nr:hypothetical protein [Ilumatobacteraceae bacterium]MCU1387543.1 hypothetical protein [Ilumatobacteraceae bacterium]